MKITRTIHFSLAWIFFAIGFIGIFLPLLPTTPFMLLTAYFFSKSSPRFHSWLLEQPVIGEGIQNWQKYGVIKTKTKIYSALLIFSSMMGTAILSHIVWWGKLGMLVVCSSILTFIITRPSEGTQRYQEYV